jgi:hypothetical protein
MSLRRCFGPKKSRFVEDTGITGLNQESITLFTSSSSAETHACTQTHLSCNDISSTLLSSVAFFFLRRVIRQVSDILGRLYDELDQLTAKFDVYKVHFEAFILL